MTPRKKHKKSSKTNKKEKMLTRKSDLEFTGGRRTRTSLQSKPLFDIIREKEKKKKRKDYAETNDFKDKRNKNDSSDDDSEVSRVKRNKARKEKLHHTKAMENINETDTSDQSSNHSDDFHSKSDKDNNNEEELDIDDEIEERVQSDDSDAESNKKDNKNTNKVRKNISQFTPQVISSIQWYVRNKLFQKIKIVNENHLESNGRIIEDVLKIAQIDPKNTINLNAYLIECRQIIKRAMCSRRGYVKRQIGEQLKGMYYLM